VSRVGVLDRHLAVDRDLALHLYAYLTGGVEGVDPQIGEPIGKFSFGRRLDVVFRQSISLATNYSPVRNAWGTRADRFDAAGHLVLRVTAGEYHKAWQTNRARH